MVGSRLLLALLLPTSKQKVLTGRESLGAGKVKGGIQPGCLLLPLALGLAGGRGEEDGRLEQLSVVLGSCWGAMVGRGTGCWGKEPGAVWSIPKATAQVRRALAERAPWP